MNGMDHGRFEELKDAYVLGALPEEERREFEEYLAAHPERQDEIERLSAVAGLLALSPEEHEPPPELRHRIMAAIQPEATPARPGRIRLWLDRFGEFMSGQSLALGAAALLVVGLFSWSMLLRAEVQDLQGQVQSRQDQSQEGRTIVLQGTGAAQGARAEVVALGEDRAVLLASNMPPVPEDKTYQIWVIKNDVPQPSSLFRPTEDSVAAVVDHSLKNADAVAVTVEPEGGSQKPTSEPVLAAQV